jgi:phosphoglycerate dehydrogenase-like enzyme
MRSDSVFVNTSRSGLVDEPALVAALKAGRPGCAALDVFDREPLPSPHPLHDAPNVLLSPHIGFVAEPVMRQQWQDVVASVEAWLEGKTLPRRADE